MEPPRWKIITPSPHEHERRALDFIRAGLPDHDPYRAWLNFEFQTPDGAIYEVDALILTKQGFWLVEIKDWKGRLIGDTGTWTRTFGLNQSISDDNPLLLANRKAKALSSLLKCQPATKSVYLPWLDALVFLSSDEIQCDLTGPARNRVFLQDRKGSESQKERKGILKALLNRDGQGIDPDLRSTIDIKVSKALSRAMESAGIRPSQRSRRVGDYVLGELIIDGPGYQDRLAQHVAFKDEPVFCRVRQYTVAHASSEDSRRKLQRAAAREFQIIQTLNHPGILPVLDYKDHEVGPTLLFRYTDPQAERLDHYLARKANQLTTDERIELLRQIADAIRYAHRKRVIHRALCPQSILVTEANTETPVLQVYNWQVGIQQAKSSTAHVTNVEDLVEAQSFVYMSPEALVDPRKVSESSDIFSLGCIAFQLFTSRPPAGSVSELTQILRERNGLSVSAVMDGAGRVIQIDAPGTVSSFMQRMGRTGRRSNTVRNCLFLATNDDGLMRAAALIDLWMSGYVEPVKTPPAPYHILAQQLMALILQERGIGKSQWFGWVDAVPGFASMSPDKVVKLVDYMVAKGILWSDGGVLAFAPEGESTFGRRNFMDVLSVFTSPPLFSVVSGQKELGNVHESTFYNQEQGQPILVLAGRMWKVNHLDWKKRIAHVEATNDKGRSRWLGEGQSLNHAVCQGIRKILASDENNPSWSTRAKDRLNEIRDEHPWVYSDATSLVLQPNGQIRWWTFAGGIANSLLANALKSHCDVRSDNLSLVFANAGDTDGVGLLIREINSDIMTPIPSEDMLDNLKFSECLSMELAAEVFASRFTDELATEQVISELRRTVIAT